MFNQSIVIGRLGQDPNSGQSGQNPWCNFSLATTEKYNDEEHTEWHSIVCFGKLAEVCSTHLKKGTLVCVTGKLQTKTSEKDGTKYVKTSIIAQKVKFLGKPKGKSESDADIGYPSGSNPEEEIPF